MIIQVTPEITRVLKRSREESLQTCQELYENKLAEIDEAYQNYLTNHSDDDQYIGGFDVTKSMRLTEE